MTVARNDELEVIKIAGTNYTLRTDTGFEGTTILGEHFVAFPSHEILTGLRSGKALIVCGRRLRGTPAADLTGGLTLTGDDGSSRAIEHGEEILILKKKDIAESDSYKFRLRTDDGFEGEVEATLDQLDYLPARDRDETVCELVEIETVRPRFGKTMLILSESLDQTYDRPTVVIHGNVARGTHGETKTEVLGSGDGSRTFSKFTLKNSPLTHIQATTASGTETTLKVRVNQVLWEEVSNLFDTSADERVYTARRANDGRVTVQFGNGVTGSRLPTGVENVTAEYRVGIGLSGLLDAGQLKLLMTRPLGVKSVINPLAPSGAEDPESLVDARANAPRTVLTLDRVVSLQDFEDFAHAHAGISKARATELWRGEQRLVHLTVAGVAESAPPKDKLSSAIDSQRHPKTRTIIEEYDSIRFGIEARVLVDGDYITGDVLAAAEEKLVKTFSFEERSFGQGVTASEVIATIQGVEGVVAVDLESLNEQDPFESPNVVANIANWPEEEPNPSPAQLLTIDPDDVRILKMT